MAPVACGDELCGDADAIAGLSDAAFQDVRHPESQGDLANVLVPALEGEGRGAGDHPQVRDPGEEIDDFLGKAVAEGLVLPVAAHVFEREDGDRRFRIARVCRYRFERGLHVAHRRESLARLLGQTSTHDPLQACGALYGGGSSRRTALRISATVFPANARVPETISYRTAPRPTAHAAGSRGPGSAATPPR